MTKVVARLKHEKKGLAITSGNGIIVETPSLSISLDPKRATKCDYTFVSHAHIDHVHIPNGKSKVIASQETSKLAKLRGYDLGETAWEAPGIDLVDAGHILGSRAMLIKDRILYTGDLCTRDRAFLKGCKGIQCDTLIIESTYGRSHYLFPETDDLVSEVNRFISFCFDNCRPVILTGYPLGKAQLLSSLFKHWEPIFVHESIQKMNNCHIDLGVDLKYFEVFNSSDSLKERASSGPWILISPSLGNRSPVLRSLREKYNAALATFSGWAIDSRYRFMMNVDRAFPMSDHCDYKELIEFVRRCSPSKVLTVHGFAAEFAAKLRGLGFDADPLERELDPQSRLTSFAA
jgi:putative mRNA 3-end processing factor